MIAARAYDVGPEAMAFDVDVKWESELTAEIEMVTRAVGARVPVSARTARSACTPQLSGTP